MRAALIPCLLSIVLTSPALGADDEPKGYVCGRASGPIKIDGKIDEASWAQAPWTDAFVDIEGDAKPLPRFRTRAKMLWDDEYFYIAAELEEPFVWATLTKHDSVIFQDNDFEVFIDPDGDNHEYYELEMNALNTEWDLFLRRPYRNGAGVRNDWEVPGLKTGVHVDGTLNDASDTDKGWSVEWAIPWKVLAEFAHKPSPPKDGDQWRVNFSRVEWQHRIVDGKDGKVPGTPEANWVWSPQGAIDMHRPEMWGYVQFSTDEPGKAAFKPDLTGPARRYLMKVYRAEQAYRSAHQRWATEPADLKLDPADRPATVGEPTLKADGNGYVATVEVLPTGEKPRRLTIRQDSQLREE